LPQFGRCYFSFPQFYRGRLEVVQTNCKSSAVYVVIADTAAVHGEITVAFFPACSLIPSQTHQKSNAFYKAGFIALRRCGTCKSPDWREASPH
jgi:hypothetical protein